jgi:eukaryotic-like serine/threonine-protein kinase
MNAEGAANLNGFPRRFGKYVLVKPLARGGMGALYLALHGQAGLDKLCVVKTALPHLADRSYLQRFRDEAKVVVRLSHGNLVNCFAAGEVKGEIYLAMDFIEGKDLRAVWNRCAQKGVAFPLHVAVHLVKELVRGLAYAHSFEGLVLVHRDVSPPNVLVSYSGEVKLTDFGLATSTLKLEKTAPGVIYGKVSYMSPEQARGEALDQRTDLYAAGVILWELLTGRQLFPAVTRDAQGKETDDDLLERVRQPQLVKPSSRAAHVPPELDVICARALSADAKDRYKNGEEMRSDLAAYLAKTAPATDGEQVGRFLRELFGEDIAKERAERELLLAGARGLLTSPDERTPKPMAPVATGPTGPSAKAAPATAPPAPPPPGPHKHTEVDDSTRPVKEEHSQIVGTVLAGRYHIKRLCGEGGMGRVYEAEHVEIGKRVAVKVLHPAYTRTPDVVERFRREARAASKIYHPNIVNVTDSGTTGDGSFFFVMEYIEGVELGYVIHREGPLLPSRVLHIAEQVCEALQAAHDVGVIHRDLKPENILLVGGSGPRSSSSMPRSTMVQQVVTKATPMPNFETVKVLDFGIAKSVDVEESQRVGRRLTRPGVAMGTPEYMAPEQAAGKPADPRSDIYAVGSIMYEMLTGAPPYDGDNVMEVLHKKANEAPQSVRSIRPDVPSSVELLVNRAMARLPESRPQSMADLAEEIRAVAAVLAAAPEPAPAVSRPRESLFPAGSFEPLAALQALRLSRRALAAAATVLVAVGALVVVRAATSARATPATPIAVAKPRPQPAVAPPPHEVAPPTVEPEPEPEAPRPAPRVKKPEGLTVAAGRELLRSGQELLRSQRYNEAAQTFRRLVAGRRERGPALVGLADIAFQQKNYEEAVSLAKDACKAAGGVEARMKLGDAYFKLKRYEEAKKAYAEALKIEPQNDTARRQMQLSARRL